MVRTLVYCYVGRWVYIGGGEGEGVGGGKHPLTLVRQYVFDLCIDSCQLWRFQSPALPSISSLRGCSCSPVASIVTAFEKRSVHRAFQFQNHLDKGTM
jgi:hypothetical protein